MPEATQIIRFNERQDLFELGLSTVYNETLKVLPNAYKEWLEEESAEQFYKTEMAHSGLGVMPAHDIGSRFATDRIYYGANKTYQMSVYGISLVIQYEVLRWDLHGAFGSISKQLAKTAVTRYDLVAYGIFNNAFSTADSAYTNYNSEALCATTHARMDGGTWKNRPTTDIGLSMTAIQTAVTDLRKTPNDRGHFMQAMQPRMLVTTVENEWLANTLLMTGHNPENANMAHNNAKAYGMKTHTSPYITTSTYWFMLADKSDYRIKMAHGDKPDLISGSEPATRNRIHTSYCSFRLEVFQSRGVYGSTG
jgi:hypothetical protein